MKITEPYIEILHTYPQDNRVSCVFGAPGYPTMLFNNRQVLGLLKELKAMYNVDYTDLLNKSLTSFNNNENI